MRNILRTLLQVQSIKHLTITLLHEVLIFENSSLLHYAHSKFDLTFIFKLQLAKTLEIGRTKLDISVIVKKAPRPEVKVELSAPVFDGAYVHAHLLTKVPAKYFKSKIRRKGAKVQACQFGSAMQGRIKHTVGRKRLTWGDGITILLQRRLLFDT